VNLLTPDERKRLVPAVFWAGTWPELRAVELEIAHEFASTPEQKAMNEEELSWLRNAVSARRVHVGRADAVSHGD